MEKDPSFPESPPVYQISNVSPVFLSSLGQKNTRPVAGAGGEGVAVG